MNSSDFDARERELLGDRTPLWIERWRSESSAITAVRFDERTTLVVLGGKLDDACAEWLEPRLEKTLSGTLQRHFIDQGAIEVPSTKVRDVSSRCSSSAAPTWTVPTCSWATTCSSG
jgi:hypothetical protein